VTESTAHEFVGGEVRCWIGRGVPGIAPDEQLVILCEAGEISAERTSHDIPKIELASADPEAPFSAGEASLSFERNGELHELSGVGALSHPPTDEEAALVRSIVAVDGESASIALYGARPAGAAHDSERASAWLLEPGSEPLEVSEPLLSTEYEQSGAARRAGLELWVGEGDELPLRGAGTKVAGTAVDLDGWRLDAGFYSWMIEGAEAAGSYLIWRR